MNKEEPYRDQAERLKKRIEKLNEKVKDIVEDKEVLPPREQVHRQRKKKTKWKLKYPVIRLLVLFFILLPIISFSVISYLDDKRTSHTEKTTVDPVGYETINLDSSEPNDTDAEESNDSSQNDSSIDEVTDSEQINEMSNEDKQISTDSSVAVENNKVSTDKTVQEETDKNVQQVEDKSTQPQPAQTTKVVYYTVKKGDTLYHISDMYFHSPRGMDMIIKANHLNNDQVEAGQVLKIPLSK